MKKVIFFIILLISLLQLKAQDTKPNPYGDKYDDKEFNALKVVQVIDACDFKPIMITTDIKQFKSLVLQLSDKAYIQYNISTWYLCSYKHEENFQIYNLYYKPVSKPFYDENCKALITLMLIDGTVKRSK